MRARSWRFWRPEKLGENFGDSTTAPIRSMTAGRACGTSVPKSRIDPDVARARPSSIRMVVVLPEPFGPEEAVHAAGGDREVEVGDGDAAAPAPVEELLAQP